MPPLCPLRTTTFETRYLPVRLLLPELPTSFVPVGGRDQTTCQRCIQPQILSLFSVDLVALQRIREEEQKDVSGERGHPHLERAGEWDTAQDRTSPPIPKLTEQGFQNKDIERWRQGAILPDGLFDRERPWTIPVHLYHCRRVIVQNTNPSGSNQTVSKAAARNRWSSQSNALDWLKLICMAPVSFSIPSMILRIKCSFFFVFFFGGRIQSSLHSVVLLSFDQITGNNLLAVP